MELPGGVHVYAVTRHAEARALLTDSRVVKDINVWGAWQRGEIPMDWPLIGLANPGRSMLTVDGADHRRLRTLVAQALTSRGWSGCGRASRRSRTRAWRSWLPSRPGSRWT